MLKSQFRILLSLLVMLMLTSSNFVYANTSNQSNAYTPPKPVTLSIDKIYRNDDRLSLSKDYFSMDLELKDTNFYYSMQSAKERENQIESFYEGTMKYDKLKFSKLNPNFLKNVPNTHMVNISILYYKNGKIIGKTVTQYFDTTSGYSYPFLDFDKVSVTFSIIEKKKLDQLGTLPVIRVGAKESEKVFKLLCDNQYFIPICPRTFDTSKYKLAELKNDVHLVKQFKNEYYHMRHFMPSGKVFMPFSTLFSMDGLTDLSFKIKDGYGFGLGVKVKGTFEKPIIEMELGYDPSWGLTYKFIALTDSNGIPQKILFLE